MIIDKYLIRLVGEIIEIIMYIKLLGFISSAHKCGFL